MWDAFVGILRDYEKDPEIRCVVVSGAGGKAFVSGADISKFESERANAEAQVRYDAISRQGYESLYDFPKPTIARITGYCIGGGMNLAACCDLRYCNEGARFGVPAAKLGLGYGFLRIERLSRIVGLPRAMEFLFTAKQYSSKEAYDMGLVHGVAAGRRARRHGERHHRRHRPERAAHHRAGQGLGARDRQARIQAGPRAAGEDGPGLLRQRRLQGRPPRLHGEAQAGLQRKVAKRTLSSRA